MSNESSSKCPQCGSALPPHAPAGLCPSCLMALNLATPTEFPGETGPHGTKVIQPPLPPGQIAPHFPQLEILEYLGRGGMGVVYKARQKTLNRIVALKLLAPERVSDPQFAERFAREARALAALDHPNIVTVYDFGVVGQASSLSGGATASAGGHGTSATGTTGKMPAPLYYLLMEFVDGANLRELLRARKFTPEEALAIVPPLCDALQFAHDRGVVHRDIKPENLLLDKAGRVKVADFGIAKMLGAVTDGSFGVPPSGGPDRLKAELPTALTGDQTVGTPSYSAPEQKTNPQRVDSRADIYSLGVVFYEMLTGELPGKRIEPPSKKVQIDVRLDEIVLRALEKNPDLRYQQVSEVKTCVETIVATLPGSSGRESAQSESGQSEVEKSAYNPWETTSIAAGTIFFVAMFLFAMEWTRPFRVPLIAMSVLGLGICVLSIAGFWPFPSPLFPEPNFSSRNLRRNKMNGNGSPGRRGRESAQTEKPEIGNPKSEMEPRFSRMAIVGACLGVAFPVFAAGSVLIRWKLSFAVILLLLGFIATTILGWIAVTQIRRSAGKLYGLGLAVFDGLLFPLLALDAWIMGVGWFICGQLFPGAFGDAADASQQTALFFAVWLSVSILVAGIADFLIIRSVWRAVNRPPSASHPPVSSPPRAVGSGPIIVAIVGGVMLILAMPAGLILIPYLASQAADTLVFSAESKITLTEFNNRDGLEALDLDRQTVLAQPQDMDHWSEAGLSEWVRTKGVDLFVDHGPQGRWALMTIAETAPKMAIVANEKWDRITRGEFERAIAESRLGAELVEQGAARFILLPTLNALPRTYAFQTHDGNSGLLQVTGFLSDNPRGVKLRYKLVQTAQLHGASMGSVEDSPYVRAIPDGRIELVGIAEHPSTNQLWWRLDGSPLASRAWEVDPKAQTGVFMAAQQMNTRRQFALHATGFSEPARIVDFDFDGQPGANGGFNVLLGGRKLDEWLGLKKSFTNGQATTQLRVRVGSGSFQAAPEPDALRFQDLSFVGRVGEVRFTVGKVFERERRAAFNLSLDIRVKEDWANIEYRLRAKDRRGRWYTGRIAEGQSSDGLVNEVYVFESLRSADVAEVQFETRPVTQVEFRDVALQPGESPATSK